MLVNYFKGVVSTLRIGINRRRRLLSGGSLIEKAGMILDGV